MYGARALCACFHEHLAAKLLALGINPSKADPDSWYRDKGDHYPISDTPLANPSGIAWFWCVENKVLRMSVVTYYHILHSIAIFFQNNTQSGD